MERPTKMPAVRMSLFPGMFVGFVREKGVGVLGKNGDDENLIKKTRKS
jgi:hypothetical protein